MPRISRGFRGRRPQVDATRVPPGQYVTTDFPVLSAGPTPHTPLDEWTFTISGAVDKRVSWTWEELLALPAETPTVDIHCVTKWSKLDTTWKGVSVDSWRRSSTAAMYVTRLERRRLYDQPAARRRHRRACMDRYESTVSRSSPSRRPGAALVPHVYFWKSAEWVRGLELLDHDKPGFWETYGYHNYGDPWKEQRYDGD